MRLLALACILISGVASAATIDLPLPTIAQIAPNIPVTACPFVKYEKPHTIVTGFSADGNYVLGTADDLVLCGHSGRGGYSHPYPYCASFTWDLSGNLVSTVVGTCSLAPSGAVYKNAGGYTAYTFVQLYFGYIQYEYPVLETP